MGSSQDKVMVRIAFLVGNYVRIEDVLVEGGIGGGEISLETTIVVR